MSEDKQFIDVALVVASATCDVSASRIESYDDRELTIKLSEDGFEEYLKELRIHENDEDAEAWLNGECVGDEGVLGL